MFSRIVPANRKTSCCTMPICAAQRGQRHVADVDAVDRDAAGVDFVEARQQRAERRLAGARRPDERDRLAGADVEVDIAAAPGVLGA